MSRIESVAAVGCLKFLTSPMTMLPTEIQEQLATMLGPRGFELCSSTGPDPNHMGAWQLEFRSGPFIVTASQDRASEPTWICAGSLTEDATSRPLRGPWPLSHLRGFLDNASSPYAFNCLADQLQWLSERLDCVLNVDMLDSDEMNDWSIAAARAKFA